MKTITVFATFQMDVKWDVEVSDDFTDVDCSYGHDEDASYLEDRLDNADFGDLANANGGGRWEVDSWELAKPRE